MAHLVSKGLRATLDSSLILPGSSGVSLDLIGKPGTAQLGLLADPPIIPAAASGGGIEGALSSLNAVAGTIRDLPLRQIAEHLRSTSARVDALVSDPALKDSLHKLNSSLTEIEKVAVTTRENIGPIAQSLRTAAASGACGRKTCGPAPRRLHASELRPRAVDQRADARGGIGSRTRAVSRGEPGLAAEGEREMTRKIPTFERWEMQRDVRAGFSPFRASILALILLAGCSFFSKSQSRFYSIDRIPGTPAATVRGLPIGIDSLEVPPGFDRREIVVQKANHALDVRGKEQWSASLAPMVLHTLAFDLASRLPEGMIVLPGESKPIAMRSMDVAFEEIVAGPESKVVLDARWILRGANGADVTRHERIETPISSLDSASIATGISQAVAELADRIVAQLGDPRA